MNFIPLHDRILVTEIAPQNNTGGLIIPHSANQFLTGKVLAAGSGKDGKGMCVSVGQTVYYKNDDAIDIVIDDVRCRMLREGDIYASEGEKKAAVSTMKGW